MLKSRGINDTSPSTPGTRSFVTRVMISDELKVAVSVPAVVVSTTNVPFGL
jgi:hypothetical protein